MDIDWDALGEVFVVSCGGYRGDRAVLLRHHSTRRTSVRPDASTWACRRGCDLRPALAALCFLACALVVGYGLYLIIAK